MNFNITLVINFSPSIIQSKLLNNFSLKMNDYFLDKGYCEDSQNYTL